MVVAVAPSSLYRVSVPRPQHHRQDPVHPDTATVQTATTTKTLRPEYDATVNPAFPGVKLSKTCEVGGRQFQPPATLTLIIITQASNGLSCAVNLCSLWFCYNLHFKGIFIFWCL